MPETNNDETLAVADVYADSLLSAASQQDQVEQVTGALAELLAHMSSDPDFATFLTAAEFNEDRRRELLEKLFRGKMNDLLLNLLGVLNNRGRCDLIPAIGKCVKRRMRQRRNQQEIFVETAVPLSEDLRSAVQKEISEVIGKEAILSERVRPELIGGIVFRIGDLQVDASVNANIRLMHKRLIERASEKIAGGGSSKQA